MFKSLVAGFEDLVSPLVKTNLEEMVEHVSKLRETLQNPPKVETQRQSQHFSEGIRRRMAGITKCLKLEKDMHQESEFECANYFVQENVCSSILSLLPGLFSHSKVLYIITVREMSRFFKELLEKYDPDLLGVDAYTGPLTEFLRTVSRDFFSRPVRGKDLVINRVTSQVAIPVLELLNFVCHVEKKKPRYLESANEPAYNIVVKTFLYFRNSAKLDAYTKSLPRNSLLILLANWPETFGEYLATKSEFFDVMLGFVFTSNDRNLVQSDMGHLNVVLRQLSLPHLQAFFDKFDRIVVDPLVAQARDTEDPSKVPGVFKRAGLLLRCTEDNVLYAVLFKRLLLSHQRHVLDLCLASMTSESERVRASAYALLNVLLERFVEPVLRELLFSEKVEAGDAQIDSEVIKGLQIQAEFSYTGRETLVALQDRKLLVEQQLEGVEKGLLSGDNTFFRNLLASLRMMARNRSFRTNLLLLGIVNLTMTIPVGWIRRFFIEGGTFEGDSFLEILSRVRADLLVFKENIAQFDAKAELVLKRILKTLPSGSEKKPIDISISERDKIFRVILFDMFVSEIAEYTRLY